MDHVYPIIFNLLTLFGFMLAAKLLIPPVALAATYLWWSLLRKKAWSNTTVVDGVHFCIWGIAIVLGNIPGLLTLSTFFKNDAKPEMQALFQQALVMQAGSAIATVLLWIQVGIFLTPWLRKRSFCLTFREGVAHTLLCISIDVVVLRVIHAIIGAVITVSIAPLQTLAPRELLALFSWPLLLHLLFFTIMCWIHRWGMRRVELPS